MSAVRSASQAAPVQVITPRPQGLVDGLREYWHNRQLTAYFGRQMLLKFYRRTWLGPSWLALRPILAISSGVFVFGGVLNAPSKGVPYLLFFLLGTAIWEMFSWCMLWGTRSLEIGRRVLTRMRVPPLACLTGAVVPGLVTFSVYAVMAVLGFLYFVVKDGKLWLDVGPNLLFVPLALALAAGVALAFSCFTAPYAAQARDVRFGVNYFLGFWMFLTPVIYPLDEVPGGLEAVMALNPMTAPVELFREGLLGIGSVPTLAWGSCLACLLGLGTVGLKFFLGAEEKAFDSL